MRKRSFVLFVLLLIFWVVISSGFNRQHLLTGAFLAMITVWFWHDLGPRLPNVLSARELLGMARCLILLAAYVIQSSIAVAKTLLFAKPPVSPVFVVMTPDLKTMWGRVFLATGITLTPGTVTVDVDPQTGQFIVHALTEESAISLFYWRLIDEIKQLETYRQRRAHKACQNPP
ncbi:MAG TPA: Na+/H+ antiporter subunit E, partial [Firmicutes bacterium]|nr:Na+/H+ antiporter subunit E [Bacillota bacterium]